MVVAVARSRLFSPALLSWLSGDCERKEARSSGVVVVERGPAWVLFVIDPCRSDKLGSSHPSSGAEHQH